MNSEFWKIPISKSTDRIAVGVQRVNIISIMGTLPRGEKLDGTVQCFKDEMFFLQIGT